MWQYLIDILPTLIFACFCIFGLFSVTELKYSVKKTILIIVPIMLALFGFNLWLYFKFKTTNYDLFFLLSIFIPEALLMYIFGKKKPLAAATAIVHVYLTFYIIFLLKNVVLIWTDNNVFEYALYILAIPIMYIYLKVFYSKLQNEIEELLPKYLYLLLLYGLALMAEIMIYRTLINSTSAHVLRLEIFGVAIISIYVISISIFYLIINQYRKRITELNNELMINAQLQMLQEHNTIRDEKDQELKILRHDMKHILLNVSTLIKNGKYIDALDFTNEYVNTIENTSEVKYCNDKIINSILDYYKKLSINNSIEFIIKINNFEEILDVPSSEMGVFISNCLDNAFNAVNKLDGNKHIDFIFLNNNGRLILQIKNNFNGSIILDSNNKPTSIQQGHGIGTSSINWFAKKHKLILTYDINDTVFSLSVLFPMKIK